MPQSKLSVVQVIDQLNVGGTENVIITLCNILSRHGHQVALVTTVSPGPLVKALDKNITVINLARKSKWSVTSMYRLYAIVKKYDVIHVHSSYNLRYLFLSAKLFFLQKPIFFHEHFGDIGINATVKWHQKFIYPKTIMICVSREIYDWAAGKLAIGRDRLFILHNVVLKKAGLPKIKARNGVLELLMVSNIRPTKNIEFALELMSHLKRSQPCRLTIIGQKNDEGYYGQILSLIGQYDLNSEVVLLHDVFDIQPVLHNYDLAIHTAKSESGPLVLIEYLAQNLPFITYNTGETVMQVRDELPLCVAQTFAIPDWAEQIDTLLSVPVDMLAEKLAEVYAAKFSGEAYYAKCIDIYEKGLAASKK